jgi:hypothetical protein
MHIGFDSGNAEIAVSLLTDREPYLEERKLDPFAGRWPVADWRLYGLNATFRSRFPDAQEVLEWMQEQAERLDSEALLALNASLKTVLFDVAMGSTIRNELARFRRVASPFKIRVQGFFDAVPLDAVVELPASSFAGYRP